MRSDDLHLPSRRTVLKGLGASLALPWLPSLLHAEDPALVTTAPPRRYASLVFANGVHPEHWWARGEGADMQLSRVLAPLARVKEHVFIPQGLHMWDDGSGNHAINFTNFLSGARIGPGSLPSGAVSADQLLARRIGAATPVPSLVLGIEPSKPGTSGGKPNIYGSTVSWSSPTTPLPVEMFPRQAFDRLFDVSGMERDRSVLDFTLRQAADLRGRLGQRDRDKLERFTESVREIERRIERATSEDRFEGWRPSVSEPTIDRPPEGRPQDVRDHVELMLDILLLAFQMDQTRVATFVFQRDVSGMSYGFLDGVSNTGMHSISHHGGKPGPLEEYARINVFHVELFARLIERMRDTDEGDGSLLDHSMLLFGSTMFDGEIHDCDRLPLVIAGRGGGAIRPGRAVTYDRLEDRRLCNLHLAMLQGMGVEIESFGNSHYPLPGLV